MHDILEDLQDLSQTWDSQTGAFQRAGGLSELRMLVDELYLQVERLESLSQTNLEVGEVVSTPGGRAIVKRFDPSGNVVVDLVDSDGNFKVDFVGGGIEVNTPPTTCRGIATSLSWTATRVR